MIWCRCNAHLVESDDDQTPDVECCGCRGKVLQAARRRWFAAHHNVKPENMPHGGRR